MLYEVDDACLASMDKVEGVPAAYRREWVTVFAAQGESLEAITYVANKTGEFRPSKSYLEGDPARRQGARPARVDVHPNAGGKIHNGVLRPQHRQTV